MALTEAAADRIPPLPPGFEGGLPAPGVAAALAKTAADMGTGCVGKVMEVVQTSGDVDGMEILGEVALGSNKTCLVVRISLGGMG